MKATGKCPPRKPFTAIVWSFVGSFTGIFLVTCLGRVLHLNDQDFLFLIGSFGASAVLVYGAPLAEFSQPRNLVGGHVVSAIRGVFISSLGSEPFLVAGALAVSLAIVVMHLTRTLHPPGGATALIAVIGGENVQKLEYWYIVSPVLTGALIMLVVALLVNNLSSDPKRHYPVYWV